MAPQANSSGTRRMGGYVHGADLLCVEKDPQLGPSRLNEEGVPLTNRVRGLAPPFLRALCLDEDLDTSLPIRRLPCGPEGGELHPDSGLVLGCLCAPIDLE